MFVNKIFLGSNAFIDAYVQSDWLGKMIFIGLLALSICSWVLIAHKFLTAVKHLLLQFLQIVNPIS